MYSDKRDIFVGGSGGINKLVVPGLQSNYSITPSSNIFDTNSQKYSLSGFVVSDKTKTFGTVDISSVQRINFSAAANEAKTINGLLTSGDYTTISLAMLAAETSNNAANIGLVGLAQTGLSYTPYTG